MNVKTTVPLAVATVFGLVAAIVSRQLVQQTPTTTIEGGQAVSVDLTDVVVAARDVPPGTVLTSEDLKVTRVETKSAPTTIAGNPSALFKRVARVGIPQGQMVHESMLAASGVGGGLPGIIRPGLRAMTIEVDEIAGLSGLIQPGDHIDLMTRMDDADKNQTTRTIAQNVEIIAIGTTLMNKVTTTASTLSPEQQAAEQAAAKTPSRAVTVLVTPEDAERINLAYGIAGGSRPVWMALRASTDHEPVALTGATLASLRGDAKSEPVTAAVQKSPTPLEPVATGTDVFGPDPKSAVKSKPSRSITVIRGGVMSQVEVDDPAEATEAGADTASADTHDLLK